jgi:alkylation response protein AidB-like acyl-CoA dehydrogenase
MTLLNQEQEMLRDSVRSWVATHSPVSAMRKIRNSGSELGFDRAAFKSIAEMGLTGVVIPQDLGGSDFGYRSMGVILEEFGRMLVAAPLIGSAIGAASAINLGGSEVQKRTWLPRIASGDAIGALAIDEEPLFEPDRIALTASKKGDHYLLSGGKTFVLEGLAADLFVVAARLDGTPAGEKSVTLFLVPADAKGLGRKRLELIDSRGYAALEFTEVKLGDGAVLGQPEGGDELLSRVLDRVYVSIAAEEIGVALQAFETTIEYMKTRVQFGQTIGSFQALQHRAAGLYTKIQLARATVEEALTAIDKAAANVSEMASMAKATANDLVNLVTREMIQIHGGIGMTDEHDAGFYLKRARVLEASFGSSAFHRERFARLNGL